MHATIRTTRAGALMQKMFILDLGVGDPPSAGKILLY